MISVEAMLLEQRQHAVAVADVELAVLEARRDCFQPLEIPARVALGAEEFAPHVVVHADDRVALPVEILDGLRADQPAASGNQNVLHPCNSSYILRPKHVGHVLDIVRTTKNSFHRGASDKQADRKATSKCSTCTEVLRSLFATRCRL